MSVIVGTDGLEVAWAADGWHVMQATGAGSVLDLRIGGDDIVDGPSPVIREVAGEGTSEWAVAVALRRATQPREVESFIGLSPADVIEEVTGCPPSGFELACLASACREVLELAPSRRPATPLLAGMYDWPDVAATRLASIAMSRLEFDIEPIGPAIGGFVSHVDGSGTQASCRVGLPTSAGWAELEVWAMDEGDGSLSAYATYVDPQTGEVPERAFGPTGETTSCRDFTFVSDCAARLSSDLVAACDLAVRGLFVPSADLSEGLDCDRRASVHLRVR